MKVAVNPQNIKNMSIIGFIIGVYNTIDNEIQNNINAFDKCHASVKNTKKVLEYGKFSVYFGLYNPK